MISSMKADYSMTLLDFRRMAASKLRDRKILPQPKKRYRPEFRIRADIAGVNFIHPMDGFRNRLKRPIGEQDTEVITTNRSVAIQIRGRI